MGTNGCSVADPERLLLGRLFFMSCVSTQVAKHLRSTARHKTAETKVDAVIHRANAFTGAYRTSRRPYRSFVTLAGAKSGSLTRRDFQYRGLRHGFLSVCDR